jgi:predicted transcriptional regulator
MGQGDILKILIKEKGWLTSKELAQRQHTVISATLVSLRKLRDRNEIIVKKGKRGFLYKIV